MLTWYGIYQGQLCVSTAEEGIAKPDEPEMGRKAEADGVWSGEAFLCAGEGGNTFGKMDTLPLSVGG
ncbi:hypothetical protein KSB_91600 [Ktedonobacter robiniae]|uniref:Uncharacterized protein n=1 Tax=Ktedonobacter robiniae TaxID=2778365 RepID=A0ABQ3V8H3_9CHLR|nr:hypothetical protein KSB_91600 [Ktedonobacter robiniae]